MEAAVGFLGVVLTPTGIGLYVVYVIAVSMGIPLLGAYLGVILAVVLGIGVFFLGTSIGSGIGRVVGTVSNINAKRRAVWPESSLPLKK